MTNRGLKSAIAGVGIAGLVALMVADHFVHAPAPQGAPPAWALGVAPFAGLLVCIAALPLFRATHHWWEQNLHRLLVALLAAWLTVVYVAAAFGPGVAARAVAHASHEYIPFILLLGALFIAAGGIRVRLRKGGTPLANTALLALGTVAASVIGTTGASMVLIRVLLESNRHRRHVAHSVIFFIFLVSNVGGTLLPIGDPPLFLGFLKGVPFLWTLTLWKEWAFVGGICLAAYAGVDAWLLRRERRGAAINGPGASGHDPAIRAAADAHAPAANDAHGAAPPPRSPAVRLEGWWNLLWLVLVVLVVAVVIPGRPLPGSVWVVPDGVRAGLLVAISIASLLTTPRGLRSSVGFTWAPIVEVAALFAGIFVCVQVPLFVLQEYGSQLGLSRPWHFFWATGLLSAFLDNAPTYLVFLQIAETQTTGPGPGVLALADRGWVQEPLLVAVSLGAVFMGAMTYIGNGPNFMVKAIAEQSGVRMPSFMGYMVWSGAVLLPLFILMSILFLR